VRAFVATFQGLSSTAKQKELLEPFGLQRASLEEAFVRPDGTLDRGRIGRLLEAMQGRTGPVRARRLGELGRAHLASGTPRGVVAHRRIEIDDPRSPVLVEAALILLDEDGERSVTVGINNSPALAGGDAIPGLWDTLGQASVEPEDPVWFFLHVTGPGFRYADRGKSRLVLTREVAGRLADELRSMLEPWRKHKRRRERDARAAMRRFRPSGVDRPPTLVEAAADALPGAYLKASDGGTLPVRPRQIMYAARDAIQEATGKPLDGRYFAQTLLPDYCAQNPGLTASWDIVWDARGSLVEPHTGRRLPLGTEEVRGYIAGMHSRFEDAEGGGWWRTRGPSDRFGAVLFVEKEGFEPLLDRVKLRERFDVAVMSTKGLSTTAARQLIDHLVGERGVPVFVVRDLDVSGFKIAGTLARDTRRYAWRSSGAVDLGLRLADAGPEGLASERVYHETKEGGRSRLLDPDAPGDRRKILAKIEGQLKQNGATEEEVEFLVRDRVELNAFTSRGLVGWLERKLEAAGVRKVVPPPETMRQAALGFARDAAIARLVAGQGAPAGAGGRGCRRTARPGGRGAPAARGGAGAELGRGGPASCKRRGPAVSKVTGEGRALQVAAAWPRAVVTRGGGPVIPPVA
jgi:hypothetical protein